LTWSNFQKYFEYRTLSFSVYLLSQCLLGPFIHMTQRKYLTIIWWPVHVLSRIRLGRSCCGKITISEIFMGVLCTVGGTLVQHFFIYEVYLHQFKIYHNWTYTLLETKVTQGHCLRGQGHCACTLFEKKCFKTLSRYSVISHYPVSTM
jgi:hypothetical protein